MITINKDHIPLNENWLNFWKQRMPIKEITKDAENIEIEKKYIKTIGKKIINNYPRGQYMGLIRLKKTYFNLFKIFKKLNNPKIDMTSF